MKIKAFLHSGRFKILKVISVKDIKIVSANYARWEYIL